MMNASASCSRLNLGHDTLSSNVDQTARTLPAELLCYQMQGETAAELLAAVSASYQDPEVRLQWPEQDPAVPQRLADLQASWHKGDQQESILRMSYKDRGRSQLSGMSPLAAADW